MSDEPMRLRIDGGRWPAILAWLEKTRLRISALELHLPLAKVTRRQTLHPFGRRPQLLTPAADAAGALARTRFFAVAKHWEQTLMPSVCVSSPGPSTGVPACNCLTLKILLLPALQEHVTASEAMGDLLSDARFQQRNAGCLQDLSVHFGLDAPALPLRGGRQPFVWRALRSLSLLRVRFPISSLKIWRVPTTDAGNLFVLFSAMSRSTQCRCQQPFGLGLQRN